MSTQSCFPLSQPPCSVCPRPHKVASCIGGRLLQTLVTFSGTLYVLLKPDTRRPFPSAPEKTVGTRPVLEHLTSSHGSGTRLQGFVGQLPPSKSFHETSKVIHTAEAHSCMIWERRAVLPIPLKDSAPQAAKAQGAGSTRPQPSVYRFLLKRQSKCVLRIKIA